MRGCAASRRGIRSPGACGGAGGGWPVAGSGPGRVCARVRGAESRGLLREAVARRGRRCERGRGRTRRPGGGQPGLSEPLGRGWLGPDLGRRRHRPEALSGRGTAEERARGPDGSGGAQSMEQRTGRAGKSEEERPVCTTGDGRGVGAA